MKNAPAGGSPFPRENINHWKNLTAEDIPTGWMDDMVKRLFECLNRQMIRLERAQIQAPDKESDGKPVDKPDDRAKVMREIHSMQRALERLTGMEMRRVAARDLEKVTHDEDACAALMRRLADRAAAVAAARDDEGPKP